MSITNYLNKIKTAVYGRDVRGAIHDAIKECYDDASVNHDNANMEVKIARGTHNTLNDRLDKSDEIQAQTNAQLSDVNLQLDNKLSKNDRYVSSIDMPRGYVNFIPNDSSDLAQTQNSKALQYYFDNTHNLENQNIVFGKGTYYFNTTVIKRTRALITLTGNSNGKSGEGLTELRFTGTGTFISLGEDDGLAENSNLYNGVGNLHINSIMLSGIGNGSLNNGANYGIGQYGIKDYRGGSLIFDNVTIQQFECGMWAIESDYNSFYDLCLRANKKGMYLGPRSDQQTLIGLNAYNNEVAVEFNGCSGVSVVNPYFVANTSLDGQVLINNSKGSTDVSFYKGWYEMHPINGVSTYANNIINVGNEFSTSFKLKFSIDTPTISNSKHKNVLKIKYASLVSLLNVETDGYHNLFDFVGTTTDYSNSYTNISLINSPTSKGIKDFTISGDKKLMRIIGNATSYGVQQLALGEQNRLDFVEPKGASMLEMFLDYGTTGLRFNHQSFDGGKYLQFQRRIFYSASIPDETNISYKKGDICFNINVSSNRYVGWVCVTAGTPGTWKGFGLVEA